MHYATIYYCKLKFIFSKYGCKHMFTWYTIYSNNETFPVKGLYT